MTVAEGICRTAVFLVEYLTSLLNLISIHKNLKDIYVCMYLDLFYNKVDVILIKNQYSESRESGDSTCNLKHSKFIFLLYSLFIADIMEKKI